MKGDHSSTIPYLEFKRPKSSLKRLPVQGSEEEEWASLADELANRLAVEVAAALISRS